MLVVRPAYVDPSRSIKDRNIAVPCVEIEHSHLAGWITHFDHES